MAEKLKITWENLIAAQVTTITERGVNYYKLDPGIYHLPRGKELIFVHMHCDDHSGTLSDGTLPILKEVSGVVMIGCYFPKMIFDCCNPSSVLISGSTLEALRLEGDIKLDSFTCDNLQVEQCIINPQAEIMNFNMRNSHFGCVQIMMKGTDRGTGFVFRQNKVTQRFSFFIEAEKLSKSLEISESLAGLFRLSCPNPYVPLKIVRGE